jgi:hypothetical protein
LRPQTASAGDATERYRGIDAHLCSK